MTHLPSVSVRNVDHTVFVELEEAEWEQGHSLKVLPYFRQSLSCFALHLADTHTLKSMEQAAKDTLTRLFREGIISRNVKGLYHFPTPEGR